MSKPATTAAGIAGGISPFRNQCNIGLLLAMGTTVPRCGNYRRKPEENDALSPVVGVLWALGIGGLAWLSVWLLFVM